jgi:hypothetical protein
MQHHMKKKELSKAINLAKEKGIKVWFTSDLHFSHENIIIFNVK